jgi:hypothetical protein
MRLQTYYLLFLTYSVALSAVACATAIALAHAVSGGVRAFMAMVEFLSRFDSSDNHGATYQEVNHPQKCFLYHSYFFMVEQLLNGG